MQILSLEAERQESTKLIKQLKEQLADTVKQSGLNNTTSVEGRLKMEEQIVLAKTEVYRLENKVKIWQDHCSSLAGTSQNMNDDDTVKKSHKNNVPEISVKELETSMIQLKSILSEKNTLIHNLQQKIQADSVIL